MKPTRRLVAAAAVLSVAAVASLSPAVAQWWNPFRRDPPPQATAPLPPPPATITGPAAAPDRQPGAPIQLTLPPADVGAAPVQPLFGQAAPAAPAPAQPLPGQALPGQPLPGAIAGQPGGVNAAELAVRIDRIEGQMRTLTGQVEEIAHRMQVLQEELSRLGVEPADRRAELPTPPLGTPTVTAAAPPAAEGLAAATTILRPAPSLTAPAPAPAPGPGDRTLANTQAPGAPFDLRLPSQPATMSPSGDPSRDYAVAYNHVLSGDYDLAEIGFRAFLVTYPEDRMAPDAQFWVGETLFTRGRFREAADEFLAGYNSYPQSAKRPETLLKLGQSLAGLGELQTACETYAAVLRQFPQAPNVVRQQVQAEQAGAHC